MRVLNLRNVFTILWDNNGSFTDLSTNLADFSKGYETIASLNHTEDYIYIGLDKPFNSLYCDVKTGNAVAATLAFQYYNGSWTSLTVRDETSAFTASGYFQFDKVSIQESWEKTTINSLDKFWIRLRPSATLSVGLQLNGINIVFSDDSDLTKEYFNILDYKGTRASFIAEHVSSRDEIIQRYRNKGFVVDSYENAISLELVSTSMTNKKILSSVDLHNLEEVRLASIYLTLHKILFNASDEKEGSLESKANFYLGKANSVLETLFLSYDVNNDGLEQEEEKHNTTTMIRMHR
jgi:hypothetical protein